MQKITIDFLEKRRIVYEVVEGELKIHQDIRLINDDELIEFPKNTIFCGRVCVEDCDNFAGFAEGTTFRGEVHVFNCDNFAGFGDGTKFGGEVHVNNCRSFAGFAEGTTFCGKVNVENCPNYKQKEANLYAKDNILRTKP